MPDMIRVDDNESRVTNKLTIVCTCLIPLTRGGRGGYLYRIPIVQKSGVQMRGADVSS